MRLGMIEMVSIGLGIVVGVFLIPVGYTVFRLIGGWLWD